MQLRKMMLVLTALGAMSGLMAGCGEDMTSPGACSSNDECGESEICHPTAQICVQTCSAAVDCPSTAKTCAPLGGTGPNATTSICQCSTDVLCNGGTDSESTALVCSNLDNVCVTACTSNAECTGDRTCNVSTGQCEEGDTEPEPTSCTGEGRSTCAYGDACSSGTCTELAAPTCSNLQGKPAASFDPATGTGHIIYNVTKEDFGSACGSDTSAQTVKARVHFYSKEDDLPSTKEGLNGFFYVRTNGTELNAVPLSNGYQRSADRKSASISLNLCTSAADNQIVLGVYFTGGNGYCATLTK
ncbi:hypothetical protein [Myxococcus vastator]|uniref:hypothetical protein n=1 Tax=Myxococcus vastator TaxID=2709664 RepID=UPI001F08236F|nr:hypothetical protein [Myxococcus vastator]